MILVNFLKTGNRPKNQFSLTLYITFSIVIVIAAVMAYINQRFLRLPNAIGVMIIAITISLALIVSNNIWPGFFTESLRRLDTVDFSQILIVSLLNFLLFAGTIRVRITDLKSQVAPILLYSTLSVILSSFIIGGLMYYILQLIGLAVPFLHCLLFGALISPTDPVAVISIMRHAGLRKSLETKFTGESIFNDGIALVLFFTILNAIRNPEEVVAFQDIGIAFLREGLGGLLLGIVIGFVASRLIKTIEASTIEVMITLAVVMGGYLLARELHVSAPLTMVAAGIVVGNYGKDTAMSDVSIDYLEKFWEVIEDILNIILFVLMGLELLFIQKFENYWWIGLIAILVVLLARFISLWIPSQLVRQKITLQTVAFMTWGGLRGGISIALALTLTRGLHRDLFVVTTYSVVVFSIIVQGLSIERYIEYRKKKK